MKTEVSVVLPFYNAESTIENAIKSILNQTFQNFELILINNNSTDKSVQIVHSFSNEDQKIVLLSEKAQGVAHAMNKGLEMARGKYIARMDADDISLPERLSKQVTFLKQNPDIGLVGSDVKYVSHTSSKGGFYRFVNWVNLFHSTKSIEKNQFIEIPVINPTIMFKREIYKELGGCIQGIFPEDYEMILRYLEAGVKMFKLPEVLLEWHDYKYRLTRNDPRYSNEAFYKIKAKYFFKWSEKQNPFHPKVWVWGAGRTTRKRSEIIENEGIEVSGYIDFVEKKIGKKDCISYINIPLKEEIFIVSMVGSYGAREKITKFLTDRSYIEGKDFVIMA